METIDTEDLGPPPAAPAQGTLWWKVKMSPVPSTQQSKKEAVPWVRPISFTAGEQGCNPSPKQKKPVLGEGSQKKSPEGANAGV